MATTAIWSVKGSLAAPLEYITQDGKTVIVNAAPTNAYGHDDQMAMRNIMDFWGQEEKRRELETVIGYVAQGTKTDEEKYVSAINCAVSTARAEMEMVKKQWNKEGGIVCRHGYQSFRPGEVTPELAHTIGLELAQRLWGDRFQIVVATHIDREHIHNHFVINSVSFADGLRLRSTNEAYDVMRLTSDKLCREYGLSVIDRPKNGRQINPTAYEAAGIERSEANFRKIMADIDAVIQSAGNMEEFYKLMQQRGYIFRPATRKYLTLRHVDHDRFTRIGTDKKGGEMYSRPGIERRIQERLSGEPHNNTDSEWQTAPRISWGSEPAAGSDFRNKQSRPVVSTHSAFRYKGKFPLQRKASHFRRLYLYYCCLFGVFPKYRRRYQSNRADLKRMRNIAKETRLLVSNHIDTTEQLSVYQSSCQMELDRLCSERKPLYRLLKQVTPEEQSQLQAQIDTLTKAIRELREKIHLCEDIQARAQRELAYQERQKEEITNERISEKEDNNHGHDTGCLQRGSESNDDPDHRGDKDAADLNW